MTQPRATQEAPEEVRVELPRLEGESARAYAAFCVYAEMGAGRSLERTRQKLGKSSEGYNRVLQEWSSKYEWQQRVRLYDNTMAQLTAERNAAQYLDEVARFRSDYRETGKLLHAMAKQLIGAMALQLQGRVVTTIQGEVITIPAIELNQNALTVAARAAVMAADLEAHSLGLDELMKSVETDGDPE